MQVRKAARVLPDPVGAEIRVVRPARICGQPCSCGSVGVPNFWTNHSATRGWAQASESGRDCIETFYAQSLAFANHSPHLAARSSLRTDIHPTQAKTNKTPPPIQPPRLKVPAKLSAMTTPPPTKIADKRRNIRMP